MSYERKGYREAYTIVSNDYEEGIFSRFESSDSQLYRPLESKERRISPKAYSVSGIEQDGRRGVRENIENGEAELNGLGIYKLKKEVLNTSFYFIKRRFFKA